MERTLESTGKADGRVALVTGGGSGVGAALAMALAADGADVVLVGRRPERLESTAQRVRLLGRDAQCVPADLAEAGAARAVRRYLEERGSRLDIVVHSAGRFSRSALQDATDEEFDATYRTNVLAPFALTRELLPALRESRGQIVFVNSSAVLGAKARTASYDASKHALKALADSIRAEVNAEGIRVTSVYLGRTATEMQASVCADEGVPYVPDRLIQPVDVADMVMAALRLANTAEVTDIYLRPMAKS